jgi:tetratricopeptide (TPR) repeat protein
MTLDENGSEKKQRNRRRTGLLIGLGLLIIMVLVVVAGIFAIRGAEDRNLANGREAVSNGDWAAAVTALDEVLDMQPAFLRRYVVEATALRGLAHYQQGNLNAALEDFDAALAAEPDLIDLNAYRANIHYQQGQYAAALTEGDAALKHEELLADHLLAMVHADRAAIAQASGRVEDLADDSSAALKLGRYLPEQTIAQLYAGGAINAFDNGDMDQALSQSMAALEFESLLTDSAQAELLANLATTYEQAGLVDQVMETSEAALSLKALPEDRQVDLLLMRARARYHQDDLNGAIGEAEEAAGMGNDLAMLHGLQALQHYLDGDEDQALAEANAALVIDDEALAYRVRGSVYFWQGKIQEALADLDQALRLDENDAEALALRIPVKLELNDLEAAEADLERAQQLNAASSAILWAEALVANYEHDSAKARALIDMAIDLDGSRPEFYTLRAETYQHTAEQELAVEDLEHALSLNEDFPWALAGRMGQNALRFDYDTYEEDANQLIELYPDWYFGYSALAWYYSYILQDQDQSFEYIDKVLEFRPDSAVGFLLRGDYHLANEEYDLAQADFERALELRPDGLSAVAALSDLNWVRGETDQSLQLLDQILEVEPGNSMALVDQAAIYRETGQLEESWQKVHEALAHDPGNPRALLMRAELNMMSDELDKAHIDLLRVIDQFPKFASAHLTQAWVYYFQGRYDEAREAALATLALDPEITQANWLLMSIAIIEEDLEGAEEQVNNWIATDPDSPEAYYWLGGVYNTQVKSDEAVNALTEALSMTAEDDLLLGDIYFERALAYIDLAEEESAEADLLATIENTTNLDLLDSSEVILADPGMQATSVDGRRIIEDQDAGYTVSFDEKWSQYPSNPAEGYVLSLGFGAEEILASVDVFMIYDWDPQFSAFDLASVIDPTADGAVTGPLETVQIGGQSGLMRTYEMVDMGVRIIGSQHILVQGDRAAVIILWAVDSQAEEFAPEFEAIVESFDLLP